MSRFVIRFLVLVFVVTTITIDAGRIFYLPLPKIHSSEHEVKTTPAAFEPTEHSYKERSISNEYLPLFVMENGMLNNGNEIEKRGNFDWEALVDTEASSNRREFDYLSALDQDTRVSHEARRFSHDSDEPWSLDTAKSEAARLQSDTSDQAQRRNDTIFLLIVGICSLVGVLGLVAAAVFWYRIQKRAEAAIDSDYPSYGVTGSKGNGSKISPSATISDRKLAQSAQMFHYQQQRQQMMAQEKAHLDAKPVHSDDSDDEAPTNGDYTVYECPGLAPTGEMEVRNPLFTEPESSSPTSHPTTNNHYPQLSNALPAAAASSTQEKSSS
ncbi:unnamed protein product [Adineta ricciae]|uniref:Neural proliferation differentiation and control protein 1 n=1 Tax=Adineta ricciae TaxID=249248 RepID=A0A813YS14_ADIRI|nr:unnamed protein product [Adineta ricciae]CAF0888898.1 unnamed protein product [Adineta ricciae]